MENNIRDILSKQHSTSRLWSCTARLKCGHTVEFVQWPTEWETKCLECRLPSANEEVVLAWRQLGRALGRWWAEELCDLVGNFFYAPSIKGDWSQLSPRRRQKIVAKIQLAAKDLVR